MQVVSVLTNRCLPSLLPEEALYRLSFKKGASLEAAVSQRKAEKTPFLINMRCYLSLTVSQDIVPSRHQLACVPQ